MPESPRLRKLLDADPDERRRTLAAMPDEERKALAWHWRLWARDEQLPPEGDWRTWLIMAGRGFGKTRAGAEWVRAVAESRPDARLALVAASLGEARAVMVEGESGLLAVSPPRSRPQFESSLRRLTWPNGAQATLYSAGEPESLRGPQHSHAWCDEIGKWDNAGARAVASWDNLLLGLRLGERPRIVATTTPRSVPLMRRLLAEPDDEIALTRGRTEDNAKNLPARYLRDVRRSFGRSLLGRQELDGELVEDLPGALWTRGRRSSSTRRWRGSMGFFIRSSQGKRPAPRWTPWKAAPGSSAPRRTAHGRGGMARWPYAKAASGCSWNLSPACASSTWPPDKAACFQAAGKKRMKLRNLTEA